MLLLIIALTSASEPTHSCMLVEFFIYFTQNLVTGCPKLGLPQGKKKIQSACEIQETCCPSKILGYKKFENLDVFHSKIDSRFEKLRLLTLKYVAILRLVFKIEYVHQVNQLERSHQVIPGRGNPQKRRTMFGGYLFKYCCVKYLTFHQVCEKASQ